MDGIIIIDKPINCTSHDVVKRVKRYLKADKVGHTGTLDPLATGVLPLLIGKGTKLSGYFIEHDKEYEAVIFLGKKTDTADKEGNIIEEKPVLEEWLTNENIQMVFDSFLGKQEQMPPLYSAIKVKGKKLYEYAREGKEVTIKPRKIEIYELKLIQRKENKIHFQVSCSKGTYIRSLCEQIAEKLHTVGYIEELRRLKVGKFSIHEAISLVELEENQENREYIKKHFFSIEDLYQDKEALFLEDRKMNLLLNGVKLKVEKLDGIYRIYAKEDEFIGLGKVQERIFKKRCDFIRTYEK